MSQPQINDLTNLRRQREFERSWQQLLQKGQQIVYLARAGQWLRAKALFKERAGISHQHFTHYPIGPDTKNLYRNQLSELFAIEQEISSLMLESQRKASPRRARLQLVK